MTPVTPAGTRVAVVGGGISGLAAAHRLLTERDDITVTVYEASPDVGGKLRIEPVAGVPVDVGAEAVLVRRPEAAALITALGLDARRVAPSTSTAFLRAGGRLHPIPGRTMMGVPSDLDALAASGVLDERALARVAAEAGADPLPPLTDDVAVGALVRDRMGDEVVDRLVEPLLGGVYAGRADHMSLQATLPALAAQLADGGTLTAAAARAMPPAGTRSATAPTPVFASLRGGLGTLPRALAAAVSAASGGAVRTGATVRSLTRTPDGFRLVTGPVPDPRVVDVDAVVVALPPAKAARLLADAAPSAAGELGRVESASVAIVTLAFRDADLPPGSGLLVAAREPLAIKGVTISSQKWALDAVPDGLTVLRASLGRAGEATVLQRDDAELVATVRRDLRAVYGLVAEPVDALVTRWGGGLPQYAVGHLDAMRRAREAVAAVPGLAVCGAVFDGVGIPACLAAAHGAADRVLAALPPRGLPARGQ